jgi:formylglycine-generating enzyme required for sulfatase activity
LDKPGANDAGVQVLSLIPFEVDEGLHDTLIDFLNKLESEGFMIDRMEGGESIPLITIWGDCGTASPDANPICFDQEFYVGNANTDGTVPDSDLPVTFVSYFGARLMANWYGKDLPSAAQWEYAAAGDSGDAFPSDIRP